MNFSDNVTADKITSSQCSLCERLNLRVSSHYQMLRGPNWVLHNGWHKLLFYHSQTRKYPINSIESRHSALSADTNRTSSRDKLAYWITEPWVMHHCPNPTQNSWSSSAPSVGLLKILSVIFYSQLCCTSDMWIVSARFDSEKAHWDHNIVGAKSTKNS